MAFACAIASGFDMDHMSQLISFAECFGASLLLEACIRYMDLCKAKHESGQWVEIEATEARPEFSSLHASGIIFPGDVGKQKELGVVRPVSLVNFMFMDPNHSLQFAAPAFSFSRSSKFCTSLYLSTGSESCRQLSNLPPFLPHPPKPDQDTFLRFPADASDGSFNGDSGGFSINDQLELQILSEQLGIDITDDGESPLLDEIYDMPVPLASPSVHVPSSSPSPPSLKSITPSPPGNGTVNKPRLRWTVELHDRFVEAVNKLEGAESEQEDNNFV